VRPSDEGSLALETAEPDIEDIEVRLLLEGIRLCYGYDFREYALAPLRRGVQSMMAAEGMPTISAYQDRILHDASSMQRLLGSIGVNVTSFFRDPDLMRCVREEAIPIFRTFPSVRIWVAGCATGEEVYTLAMVLAEEDMLRRASIYATDLNEDTLAVARTGSYQLDRVRRSEEPYRRSGGRGRLSGFYSAVGRSARFDRSLQSNVTWARHSLVSDASFNDFHLIICANVLIYFRPSLQERVHRLFYDSLVRSGFLALGRRESLIFCPDRNHYEQVREGVSLYRKLRW
jgi:chemotaxis protein methyltransferase CheR